MKKLLLLSIFIAAFIFVTACTDETISIYIPEHILEATNATVTPITEDNETSHPLPFGDDVFTIYMPTFNQVIASELEMMAYATKLLQDAGLNIRFTNLPAFDDLSIRLNSVSNQSVILTHLTNALPLYQDGLLGDFYEVAWQYAPSFLGMVEHTLRDGSMPFVPIENIRITNAPAVLIRNDIYTEWDHPITNVQEYEALLRWLWVHDNSVAPGIFIPQYRDSLPGPIFGYLPLNFFLRDAGYSPLIGMLLQETHVPIPLWINDESGEIQGFYEIPAAVDAMLQPLVWRNAGLFEIWNGQELRDIYPTILVDSAVANLHWTDFYRHNYTIIVIPPAVTYISYNSGHVAIAPPNADIRPFLQFLEWLTIPENYRLFMFGIEGLDYALDSEGYIVEFLNEEYHSWIGRILFNNILMQESLRHISEFDKNFIDIMYNTVTPEFPLDRETRLSISRELLNNNLYLAAINNNMASNMDFMMRRIYSIDTEVEEARYIVETTFNQISRSIAIETAENLVREALARQ